jgi:hypothetical protein
MAPISCGTLKLRWMSEVVGEFVDMAPLKKVMAMEQGLASGALRPGRLLLYDYFFDFTGRERESAGWCGTGRAIWLLAD